MISFCSISKARNGLWNGKPTKGGGKAEIHIVHIVSEVVARLYLHLSAIFPAVFAFGIEPDSGPGLVFITLPNVFQQMPGGYFFSIIFFFLLVIAALTSSISLLEVIVAYFAEELNMTRAKATMVSFISVGVLGVLCALSFGPMSKVTLFGFTIFQLFDYVASNILLPVGGMLIVFFAGWVWARSRFKQEIIGESKENGLFKIFMFIIKFVAPFAIALVFLNAVGLLKF
jgi:NSS family neurotransmitter:Na+ symporter